MQPQGLIPWLDKKKYKSLNIQWKTKMCLKSIHEWENKSMQRIR